MFARARERVSLAGTECVFFPFRPPQKPATAVIIIIRVFIIVIVTSVLLTSVCCCCCCCGGGCGDWQHVSMQQEVSISFILARPSYDIRTLCPPGGFQPRLPFPGRPPPLVLHAMHSRRPAHHHAAMPSKATATRSSVRSSGAVMACCWRLNFSAAATGVSASICPQRRIDSGTTPVESTVAYTRSAQLNSGQSPDERTKRNTRSSRRVSAPWRRITGRPFAALCSPGDRVSSPESPHPGRFPNPAIPGLSRCQSRDFRIKKIICLIYTILFQSILRIFPFIESTSRVISSRWTSKRTNAS